MKRMVVGISALLLGACASSTDELHTSYISPLTYQDYSCSQLGAETARISRRSQEVAYGVNKNAEGDSIAMGAGLILFWPALFFIDGDTPQAQEYSHLKGEYDAVEQAMVQKDCTLSAGPNPFAKIEADRRIAEEAQREARLSQRRRN